MMQSKHTISFRVTDDEKHLIQSYAASHHLSVSSFIRDLVLDQLEEDGELEEARILKALELWNFRIKKSTIWRKCYKNG